MSHAPIEVDILTTSEAKIPIVRANFLQLGNFDALGALGEQPVVINQQTSGDAATDSP